MTGFVSTHALASRRERTAQCCNVEGEIFDSQRRALLIGLTSVGWGFEAAGAESLPVDLAERIDAPPLKAMDAKLRSPDIYYPEWMLGSWMSKSTLTSVSAPAGEEFFGRPGAYDAAKKDIGSGLEYKVRFRRRGGLVIADRPYNVLQISLAVFGSSSVLTVDEDESNVNRIQVELLPREASGVVFQVDLQVTGRDSPSNRSGDSFCCAELVHQTVKPLVDGPSTAPPLVKDVETVTCYHRSDDKSFSAKQKTSMYFPRGPRSRAVKGVPLDVRTYDIEYVRV